MSQTTPPIVFPIFERVTHLDFTGPHQVFSYVPEARITVASLGGRAIEARGFVVSGLADLRKVESCDVLCVPGGSGTTEAMIDEAFMAEIRRLASGARYLTSVCTGSLILGAAGMLRGKGATTHWATHDLLDTGEGLAVTHNQAPPGAPLGKRRSNISSSGYRRYLPAAPGLIPGLRSFGRPRLDGRPPSFGPAASAALRWVDPRVHQRSNRDRPRVTASALRK